MSKCINLSISVALLVLPLHGQTGSYPRIGSEWWGESIYTASPSQASQIQLYLAPNFTPAAATAVRASAPTTRILTTINAESTVAGMPSLPDSYYLKTASGQKIVNWPGNPPNYVLNITNPSVAQFLAQYAYQQMTQTGFVYDGVFFDNFQTTISQMTTDAYGNPIQIDADGDGIADSPATLDAAWAAGAYNLIAQFSQLAPTAYVSGHMNQIPPDPRSLTYFNGDSFVFDAVNIREGQMAFGQLWNSYQAWFPQGKPPVVTMVQSAPPNQIAYGYGYTPLQVAAPSTVAFGQTFYPNMRFGLGLALMNDGYSVYDFGDTTSAVTWWYDEYNFNLGTPATPASPLVPTAFPNLVSNGGFESTLSPWLSEVTPDGQVSASIARDTTVFESGASSAHVTVNSAATQNWNVDLEQDGLSLISGVEYEVRFWARADSPLPIQLFTQGGPPNWASYGLFATVNLDTTWRQYTVSFVSPVTASDTRLQFWFGEYAGNYWLDNVQFSQAPTRLYRRDFSNGIALLNGTTSSQTISLENGFQRFTGAQAPLSQYIVDDSSSSFTTTGQWIVDSFDTGFRQAYGPYYHAWQGTCHELDSGSGTAQWNLGIPADGQYTIQVWLPAAPTSSTWTKNAVYQVIAGGQVLATFSLDQSMAAGGDQWFTVANINLTAASAPVLRVSNGGSGALIADAVYVYSSAARYNDGSTATQVTLAPMDSILLERRTPNQTISFGTPGNQNVGAQLALTASASSGLPVAFASNTLSTCSVAGSTATMLATGACSITARQTGNATFTSAVPVTQSFTVVAGGGQSQTITFPSLPNQTFGAAPFTISATASSGLPVSFTSGTATVCTVSGNTVTIVAAGTCSITASQAGNANYSAAAPVTQSFTVAAGVQSQTISFPSLPNQTFGVAPFAISATASSGLPVSFTSGTTTVCTVSSNTVTIVAAGTCSITASQAGNANYSAATPVTRSFTVAAGAQSQTITFPSLPNQTLGAAPFTISATASSGLPVSFTSSTTTVCAISGNTVTLLAAGACSITASQAGNANYSAATPVTRSFTVISTSQAPQTISFAALTTEAMGGVPFPISATATSGLPVAFTSGTTTICTLLGTTVTLLAPGTCSLTANQSGNATYLPAPPVTRSFTVVPNLLVNGGMEGTLSPWTFNFTKDGSGKATASLDTSVVRDGTSSAHIDVISAATAAWHVDFEQGNIALTSGATYEVQFWAQAGSARSIQVVAQGGAPSYSYYGLNTTVSIGTGWALYTLTFVAPVTATDGRLEFWLGNVAGNVWLDDVQVFGQSGQVQSQVITFAPLPNKTLGSQPFTINASASSGLPVNFTSGTTTVCTVSGNTVTLVAVGTCSITASQAGNANYSAATPVTQSFTVSAGVQSQTITFPYLPNQTFGAAPFTISATASSGLPVNFTSGTTTVCTVSGNTVTIGAVGTCAITASQAGNTNYSAATPVTQSFTINQASQTISFPAIGNRLPGMGSFAISATASSGLPVSFTSGTPSVCAVSGNTVTIVAMGACSITASQSGNASYAAAPPVTQSFTIAFKGFA